MPLEKVRVLSVLVLAAVTSSLISGEFLFVQFLIYVGITIPLWFPIDLAKIREMPYWRILIFVGFVVFVGSRFVGFQFRNTLFFLILCCIVYEYYGEKRPKAPVRLISLLSFLFMLSQVRQNYGLLLLASISIYLIAVVWCLMNFHSGGIAQHQFAMAFKKRLPRATGHAVLITMLGVLIYWAIPRLPDQSMAVIGSLSGNRLSGFSDSVSLNDIGTLKLSRKHIMDLTPLDGTLHSRYLKGKVLDRYQEGTWTSSTTQSHFMREETEYFPLVDPPLPRESYRYRVDLEPMQNNTMFFFNDILAFSGRLKHLKLTGDRNSYGVNQIQVFRFYPSAISYTMFCGPEGAIKDPSRYLKNYLELPPEQSYFFQLARKIAADANATTDVEKIQAFNRFFLNQFTYTLEINNYEVPDPLREFVENRKQGHCELFASSLVLLLRAENIPARLVTGFLVPERHPAGDFYSITESDAHAWVEVYQNGQWLTLDPTPPAIFIAPSLLQIQTAYLNYLWRTKIVLWDSDHQRAFWTGVFQEVQTFVQWFKREGWTIFVGLCLLLILGVLFQVFRRRNHRGYPSQLFAKLDRLLQKYFGIRPQSAPWGEWLQQQYLDPTLKNDLQTWVHRYQRNRFGRSDSSKTDAYPLAQEAILLSRRLKQWRKHHLNHIGGPKGEG